MSMNQEMPIPDDEEMVIPDCIIKEISKHVNKIDSYNQQNQYHCILLLKNFAAKYLEHLWDYSCTYDNCYHFHLQLIFGQTVEEICDGDSGELSKAHDQVIKSLEGDSDMYCCQYLGILTNNFDHVPNLDADAGITINESMH
jgi:hypothetical protein